MKNRILVVLIALALVAVSSVAVVAAQSSTLIKVVTLGDTNVYAEANAEAEVAASLPASTIVEVLGVAGDFFIVDGGYLMASDVAVMNLPALAPKVIVSTSATGTAALFAQPNVSGDIVATVPDGTVATLLAADGVLAFVDAGGQKGWSVASAWAAAPEDFAPATIQLNATDQAGVFAEANISADIVATLAQGDRAYVYEDTGEDFVQVMLADGSLGFVQRAYLNVLPAVWADAVAGTDSVPALFDKPDFGGNVIASLDDGATVTYLAEMDDFWAEVYHPTAGVGYILKANLSGIYAVGTVQEANALVRDGAGDEYYAVAQLQPGDRVIVRGFEGDWVHVALPFEKYFDYNGKDPYMFSGLLQNQALEYDFDAALFTGATE